VSASTSLNLNVEFPQSQLIKVGMNDFFYDDLSWVTASTYFFALSVSAFKY
jgi:hypothetical protein